MSFVVSEIKGRFQQETRRISLPVKSDQLQCNHIIQFFEENFSNLPKIGNYYITFKDEDGDSVIISNNDELKCAIKVTERMQKSALVLNIQEILSDQSITTCNSNTRSNVINGKSGINELILIEKSKIHKNDEKNVNLFNYSIQFIQNVKMQDEVDLPTGTRFMKCWRLQNSGIEPIPFGSKFIFVEGYPIHITEFNDGVILPEIFPNEFFDLEVEIIAPSTPGTYHSFWQAINPINQFFGCKLPIKIHTFDEPLFVMCCSFHRHHPVEQQNESSNQNTYKPKNNLDQLIHIETNISSNEIKQKEMKKLESSQLTEQKKKV